ncbi:MAG: hypothetical protein IT214_08005 [Chitinophagaceae bacterium]|jgi:predicted secreted protein|nr:hypothetical protein [Chitinophagaceae bacterium]OQY92487.1 MAG: hypothetical protein B6D37_14435 [Sphingobacteriales bacterium UTBCD1]
MTTRLAVDEQHELKEINVPEMPQQPAVLRIMAKIISVLLHPLFIPVYVVWFLLYVQPYYYAGFSEWDKSKILISAILMYTFFPLVTVGLLKALKFIDSIFLKTQRDRIIPYVVCGIWYFWMWYVWHNLPDIPAMQVKFGFAIFLASSIGLIANSYLKVSMHALAAGVLLMFMLTLSMAQAVDTAMYLTIAILITGLSCTARLIASDHSQKEIYTGLFIGIISQLVSNWFA